jgi:hypothetical protein
MKPQYLKIILTNILCLFIINASYRLSLRLYVPPWPTTLNVIMYELYPNGASTGRMCNYGNLTYGCTAYCNNFIDVCQRIQTFFYPYGGSTINIPLETYYLLDVMSAEMDPSIYKESQTLKALAIAERSYIGYHISHQSLINNSTQYQVFIPYKFDAQNPWSTPLEPNVVEPCSNIALLNSAQRRACDAVALKYYISPAGSDEPARTNHFMDVRDNTYSSGDQSYLIGVQEPISTACDAVTPCYPPGPNCTIYGMSQRGAGRWVLGHECSYLEAPTYPGNSNGEEWSVRWFSEQQILFHYYTGVYLRDKDTGAYIGSSYRWNPLQIDGLPTIIHSNNSYPITINVQNTGIEDWSCAYPNFNYQLNYKWTKYGYIEYIGQNPVGLCPQARGSSSVKTVEITVPNWGPGLYALHFDVYVTSANGNFWFSNIGWPTYSIRFCLDGTCMFLPITRR